MQFEIGRVEGNLVINPSPLEDTYSDLNLVVVGSRNGIVMVEGGCDRLAEEIILEAIFRAYTEILKLLDAQEQLRADAGKPKREVSPPSPDAELIARIKSEHGARIEQALLIPNKLERHAGLAAVYEEILTSLGEEAQTRRSEILGYMDEIEGEFLRKVILEKGQRIDGQRV